MALPRVLLIEDDPSLRRFVQLALEELPIELLACATVDQALLELGHAPVRLLLTDLTLPGRSGIDLLKQLQREPSLRADARLAVFSGGLQPAVRQQLQALDVWRLLAKPCSIMELESCVRDALEAPPAGLAPEPAIDALVASHFDGNRALYQAFRASCLPQLANDVQTGDLACQQNDAQALRRLAHSLKSVLLILGQPQAAEQAVALETRAQQGDWATARPVWRALRAHLQALR